MSPDLKRLCEAAEATAEREGLAFPFERSGSEAIVRAVLTALREPSEGMVEAGQRTEDALSPHGKIGGWTSDEAFTAMIDQVLFE